jgi:flagellar motor switch/type III secretory pathway protein FliN
VLDGRIVARGQLVVTGDNFGVCITEIIKQDET